MMRKEHTIVVTATSPAAASTVIGPSIKGANIRRANKLIFDVSLQGATGGTLDVYLQRKVATDTWKDFAHFTQLAAAAAAVHYTFTVTGDLTTLTAQTSQGTDASPNVSLTANSLLNQLPGEEIRVIFVAGASTSAGALQTFRVTPYVDLD